MSSITGQQLTDKDLIDRVLSGDKRAFGIIINKTEGLVARIICNIIPGSEDRKDIVQDTYLKAFHKLNSFTFQSKLSTWIGQIAYHTSLSWLRKKKLVLPGDLEERVEMNEIVLSAHSEMTTQTSWSQAERLLVQKDLSGILRRQMEALPATYQLLIGLFHQEELSYAEIMQITGLPEGTVKNYLFRARKTLKQNLLSTYKREAL